MRLYFLQSEKRVDLVTKEKITILIIVILDLIESSQLQGGRICMQN